MRAVLAGSIKQLQILFFYKFGLLIIKIEEPMDGGELDKIIISYIFLHDACKQDKQIFFFKKRGKWAEGAGIGYPLREEKMTTSSAVGRVHLMVWL